MGDVCFSGGSLTLLGILATALQAAIVTLFLSLRASYQDSLRDVRAERDRAQDQLDRALQVGQAAVGAASAKERRR